MNKHAVFDFQNMMIVNAIVYCTVLLLDLLSTDRILSEGILFLCNVITILILIRRKEWINLIYYGLITMLYKPFYLIHPIEGSFPVISISAAILLFILSLAK